MRPSLFGLIALIALGAPTISCRRSPEKEVSAVPASPSAVAVVAGQEISEEMLRAEVRRRLRSVPAEGLSVEQKLEALERLVLQEAIYAQAKASGFDQSPEIQARIKNLIVAQFREQRLTNTTPIVSEQELRSAYEANGSRFIQPAALRAAAIFVSQPLHATAEKRSEARNRAEAILNQARAGDDSAFARLATQYSDDQASRYRGGDLGWISGGAPGIEPALAEALENMEMPGALAPLIETSRGFFIAKLTEKRETSRQSLAEVKELLKHQLSREKAAHEERAFQEAMKAGLDIWIDRKRVEQLAVPAPKSDPPRLPGVTVSRNP